MNNNNVGLFLDVEGGGRRVGEYRELREREVEREPRKSCIDDRIGSVYRRRSEEMLSSDL